VRFFDYQPFLSTLSPFLLSKVVSKHSKTSPDIRFSVQVSAESIHFPSEPGSIDGVHRKGPHFVRNNVSMQRSVNMSLAFFFQI
jgi:hypothetical protein